MMKIVLRTHTGDVGALFERLCKKIKAEISAAGAELVNERGKISAGELSQLTDVSEVTVRQDLNAPEQGYYLRPVHGSAVALDSDDVSARMQMRYKIKHAPAAFAASLVNFIAGGGTNALLAGALSGRGNLTIVTVSHFIAPLLKDSQCEVIMLGGWYQKNSESAVGPLTRFSVLHIHSHQAFTGIDGWHQQSGFTGRDMMRCVVVNAVMVQDVETIALTDSSKFGLVHPYPLARAGPFSPIVTDGGVASALRQIVTEQGMALDIVRATDPQ